MVKETVGKKYYPCGRTRPCKKVRDEITYIVAPKKPDRKKLACCGG
jgi:hypothetical protein